MKHAQIKKVRLGTYSALTASLIATAAAVNAAGGVDDAHPAMLWLLMTIAAIFCILVVVDTAYHSITKKDPLCIYCGEPRRMQSFSISKECPNCGK